MQRDTERPNGTPDLVAAALADLEATAAGPRRLETGEVGEMTETRRKTAEQPVEASGGRSINIPLDSFFKIAGAIFAIAAVVWTLRSDIRDVKTSVTYQFEIQREAINTLSKMQDTRWQSQVETNKVLSGKLEMQSLTLDDIELALAKAGLYTPKGR